NIYVQHFDGNANKVEDNFLVSEGLGNEAFDLFFAQNPGDSLLAVWANIGVRSEIVAQVFDQTGKVSGGNFTVSDGLVLGERFSPNAIFRVDGSVFISFTDTRSAFIDIYAQILNSDFSLSGNNFKLTTGATGAQQVGSDIVRMAGDDFGVVWTDLRNDDGDIFFQRGDGFGNPYGSNLKLNDDLGRSLQDDPSIGSATNGLALAAWVDGRSSGELTGINIFAQRIGANGQKVGSNFPVNDDPAGTAVLQAEPECDIAPSGKAVVAWRDRRNGVDDIFAQLYDASGSPVGMNFKVNLETLPCKNPKIAMANDESFMIAWLIELEAKSYIKFQLYSAQGTPAGGNMLIPADTSINQQLDFDLSVNPYFGFYVLAWINQNNAEREINAMLLNPDGSSDSTVMVISDAVNLGFEDISVDMDTDNSYVVAWSDMRSGVRRSYLSFVDAGLTVYPDQLISQKAGVAREQEPAIAINGRTWFASWSDNRNVGDGYDIYANSNLYNPTSAGEDGDSPVPDLLALSQNYPNPFNPITRIDFNLPRDMTEVSFEVYNVLGRKVYSETMKNMSAGSYTIEFNGEGLSSGIYLYRLKADDRIMTRKMSLLK
ncbi:MAG TPA: T9SS type A sorting domain-containing protein, partial [candidate division Zixibacteria bacterium]|nr:T9SS type A sorting domain-containing protein [candidate division Zixibacteria bacterium]